MAYKWKLVALLFCCAALNYGDRAATSSLFPLFRTEMGMTTSAWPRSDRFSCGAMRSARRLPPVGGPPLAQPRHCSHLAAWSLITLATGFVTSVQQLLASRVLLVWRSASIFRLRSRSLPIIMARTRAPPRSDTYGRPQHRRGRRRMGLRYLEIISDGRPLSKCWERPVWSLRWRPGSGCATAAASAAADRGLAFAELAALLRVRTYLLIISEAALVAFANLAYMNWLPLYFSETFEMTLAGAGFSGHF